MGTAREELLNSMSYFELRDAFRAEGCAICGLLLKWTRAYLDSLLYEHVNDPGVRVQLRESYGFCNWHAWMATSIGNSSSGIAIIYEHLLTDQLDLLRRSLRSIRSRPWLMRLLAKWPKVRGWTSILPERRRRAACPACSRRILFFEDNFIETLLSALTEKEFADGFRLSLGLCLPHLYQAITTNQDHPNLPLLLELQLDKLQTLRDELSEHIRKLDYRFLAEPWGNEKTAWRRVIELFVGKPELFGPDHGSRIAAACRAPTSMSAIPAVSRDLQAIEQQHLLEHDVIRDER